MVVPWCLLLMDGSQDDATGVDGFVDEDACQRREVVRVFGCEILAGAAAAAMVFNFRMTEQIIGEAFGHNGSLLDNIHTVGHILVDFIDK